MYVIMGYKRKSVCEKCSFRAVYQQQLLIHHIDHDPENFSWNNLKTICKNCEVELQISRKGWTQGDLQPDV